uniref:Uncharacterized protein n=1 Tax=Rhizophora mucronata TaxID=61149 RepID=A0A2P2PH55_RHIMU
MSPLSSCSTSSLSSIFVALSASPRNTRAREFLMSYEPALFVLVFRSLVFCQ